ncbi:MAG: type II toxin-antitoxin system VapC family toxin [Candidatus Bathyarchaeota archaeon]|nr:type II toxin-antitoxin system VapC family toxin [Candidatus Bathyarchaeota archaeon]
MESIARVCIDTDVLIDYLRKPSLEVRRVMECIFEKKLNACITSINAFEIWFGAYLALHDKAKLAQCTKEFLSQMEVVDFNYNSAVEAGRVLADLRKCGEPIEIRDLFVGCICKVSGMTLITRNLKHYKRISGLRVLTPEQTVRIF